MLFKLQRNYKEFRKTMKNSEEFLSEYYDKKCHKYGKSHKAVGWVSRETQFTRYRLLNEKLKESWVSVLDIGCGQGDFLEFLQSIQWNGEYKGVDLSEEMINQSRQRYPHVEWQTSSLERLDESVTADWVVAFGVFSLRDEMGKFPNIRKLITRLYQHSKKAVVVNTLSSFAPEAKIEGLKFVYYDPMILLSIALSLTNKVELIHGTLPNDVTLIMYRTD